MVTSQKCKNIQWLLLVLMIFACVGGYDDEMCAVLYDELVRVRARVRIRARVWAEVGVRVYS